MVRKNDVKRTKIVCTLGPASETEDVIREMIRAGMDVARINFSHGKADDHRRRIEIVRKVAAEEGAAVAILGDLQGPKIRIGQVKGDGLQLNKGDTIRLTLQKGADGTDNVVTLPHPEFVADVKPGNTLLLDDGNFQFRVTGKTADELICEVLVGGTLTSNKGASAPDANLMMDALPPKDREDLKFALDMDVDYIAMSFVRSAKDVDALRMLINFYGYNEKDAFIVSKIEMALAIENIDGIIAASDGIMVARGDLGVETELEMLPFNQKNLIRKSNEAGKPVITATQMLESMRHNPRPTRAETLDVANAIIDGSDAVMLSAETSTGDYPIITVQTMAKIAEYAEAKLTNEAREIFEKPMPTEIGYEGISDAIAHAAVNIAGTPGLDVKLIVTATKTGYTSRQVSRGRPRNRILCVTPSERVVRRMALVWGVYPIMINEFDTIDAMIRTIVRAAYDQEIVARNDLLVMLAGVPFGMTGSTNFLKIHKVGDFGEV